MNSLLNGVVRLFFRTFLPGIAKSLEREGQFDFREKSSAGMAVDPSLCIEVENNGSDVTLICFAGMAVLYAAMPKFEFRKTLLDCGGRYNFIWIRDVHRSLYNRAPDGSPNGFAAYTRLIGDALAGLNSTFNVMIGASGGGAAAFAFSGVLPVHQVIAFNPAFPASVYCSRENLRKVLFDVKKLLFTPLDYFEVLLVTLGGLYLWRHVCRVIGPENVPDAFEHYVSKQWSARAAVFYSTRAWPDARQALSLKDVPGITLRPVDCGRHNCMGELKRRGEFGAVIHQEIINGLNARNP